MHQRKTLDIDVGYLPERPKSVMPTPSPKKILANDLIRPSSVLTNIDSPTRNVQYNELNNKPLGPKPEYCNNYRKYQGHNYMQLMYYLKTKLRQQN